MAEPREEQPGKIDVERTQKTERESGTGRTTPTRGGGQQDTGRLARRDIVDPFATMHTLRHQMDRLFDDFAFGGSLFRSPVFGELGRTTAWSPQVEIYEKDGKLHVSADLPGLSKDDVNVELNDNILAIRGERRSQHEEEGWSERTYGSFFRSIPLPDGVNADTAKANFQNGVLEVTVDLPQQQASQRSKRIEIK
jgi:HSP20 family protein